ncbi:MAG: hypothetical protein QM658_03520 [Gordonia sp. (in: high G+C Gram-positive bacteria)]
MMKGKPVEDTGTKAAFGRAFDGIGRFTKKASAQVAEQSTELADKVSEQSVEWAGVVAEQSGQLAEQLSARAVALKESASEAIDNFSTTEPDPYEVAIIEYNGAFTSMNDKGVTLLRQRERSADVIALAELLVNSIANTPKSFEADFEQIHLMRAEFLAAEDFARNDLNAARKSATGAGAGLTAAAAVASMAPTAAMWVATTFGTASTGTAISTLSGAAATNAALAWLGGGAAATGGGGTAAGGALLALAGPIGWTVAGATLLASVALFAKKRYENREAKHEALSAVKSNTTEVKKMDAQIGDILDRTGLLREEVSRSCGTALGMFGADFRSLMPAQQTQLGTLVNNTKACAALLGKRVETDL